MASVGFYEFVKQVFSFCGSDIFVEVVGEAIQLGGRASVGLYRSVQKHRRYAEISARLAGDLLSDELAAELADDICALIGKRRGKLDMKLLEKFFLQRTRSFAQYVDEFPSCKSLAADARAALADTLTLMSDAVLDYYVQTRLDDKERAMVQAVARAVDTRTEKSGDYLPKLAERLFRLPPCARIVTAKALPAVGMTPFAKSAVPAYLW